VSGKRTRRLAKSLTWTVSAQLPLRSVPLAHLQHVVVRVGNTRRGGDDRREVLETDAKGQEQAEHGRVHGGRGVLERLGQLRLALAGARVELLRNTQDLG
jgi:hypothetical protein